MIEIYNILEYTLCIIYITNITYNIIYTNFKRTIILYGSKSIVLFFSHIFSLFSVYVHKKVSKGLLCTCNIIFLSIVILFKYK